MNAKAAILGLLALISTPAAVYAEAPLGKLVLLRPSAPPAPGSHLFYYAKELGFYEREGLEIEIKHLASETLALRSLLAGEGDICDASVTGAIQAVNAGARLNAISAFTPATNYMLVAHKDIPNLADLAGRSVAVAQIGAVSHIVTQLMIESVGADISKINWVVLGANPDRLQAVISKKVAAAPLFSPSVPRALAHPFLHVLAQSTDVVPQFLFGLDVVRSSDLGSKSAAFHAYVAATQKAVSWLYDHVDQAIAISTRLMPGRPPGEVAEVIKTYVAERHWSADGVIPLESWRFTTAKLVEKGAVNSAPGYRDFALGEFTDERER